MGAYTDLHSLDLRGAVERLVAVATAVEQDARAG